MIDIHEVAKKLIGQINPIGETNTDDKRFENLKVMTDLIDKLLQDICEIEFSYKHNQEYSMKRACDFAREFLDKTGLSQ